MPSVRALPVVPGNELTVDTPGSAVLWILDGSIYGLPRAIAIGRAIDEATGRRPTSLAGRLPRDTARHAAGSPYQAMLIPSDGKIGMPFTGRSCNAPLSSTKYRSCC